MDQFVGFAGAGHAPNGNFPNFSPVSNRFQNGIAKSAFRMVIFDHDDPARFVGGRCQSVAVNRFDRIGVDHTNIDTVGL